MIRRINRIFQDYMREKRLKIGKYILDRKEKKNYIKGDNFILDNNIKSILFLRHDGKIGDMVINTLMFREIKKMYPTIKIGVVTRGAAKDIITNNSYVDKIYDYKKDSKNIKKLANEIKNEEYDLLIDFSEMLRIKDMMFIKLCNVKYNMGLDRRKWNLFDLSVNSHEDFNWKDHITDRYRAYLKKLGFDEEKINVSYDVSLEFNKKYDDFFEKIEYKKIVILNPYGASKHKCFSIEILDKIIKYLKQLNIGVVLLHFSDKYKELKSLEENNFNLYIPKNIVSIQDSSYIISKGDYVITPDTSIVHIASALNKDIIAVYPPNGGINKVDHLVWAPKSKYNRVIFCKNKKNKFDEVDINTFDFEEMKNEILKMVKE